MMLKFTRSVLAIATTLVTAAAAHAAPLINLQLLGSTAFSAAGAGYTTYVNVTPGQTVYYELVATLAAAGTTNTSHNPAYIIAASQKPPGTAGDGLDGIAVGLTDAQDATLSLGTLQSGFGNNTALGAGEMFDASSSQTVYVNALQYSDEYISITSAVQVATGSLVAGSFSTYQSDVFSISNRPDLGSNTILFTAKINTTAIDRSFNGQVNNTSDPYVGFANLTMSDVPAPGVVPALGWLVAGVGLLGLYRHRRIALTLTNQGTPRNR